MTEENPYQKGTPSNCPECGGDKIIVNGDDLSCADCSFKGSKGKYVND